MVYGIGIVKRMHGGTLGKMYDGLDYCRANRRNF